MIDKKAQYKQKAPRRLSPAFRLYISIIYHDRGARFVAPLCHAYNSIPCALCGCVLCGSSRMIFSTPLRNCSTLRTSSCKP